MKKLSDFQDEEALDLLADVLVPISEIAQDEEIQKAFKSGSKKTIADVVRMVIKEHKSAVMDILAALDGVPREDYHVNFLTVPRKVMEIINDADMMAFFQEQGQIGSSMTSGSVTENTTVDGE